MTKVKDNTSSVRATLIGDVVGSRHASNRAELHRRVDEALAEVAGTSPVFTVGDEFQGNYTTVGAAIDAALTIRLALAPDVDVRFGIGWGGVTVLDAETGIQDGPGWWSARDAIEWTATAQQQPALASVRTAYRRHGDTGPDPDAVNAALLCRDHLLGSVDARSLRLLRGLLDHKTKKELAAMEGISASAVSQRTTRDGLDLLVLASEHLRDIR
ncbi:SatD family protein [Mycobacterium sp. CVI_P3]|uniref:SatD family protein n=1 Tax=Mycobacterium pinniadriaticum TaxID=2994102 RepID=A0ABT3S741_9MYCO|nr:SatD family protein [Mycobacterium pinniadriaticum]MCX2928961.1 SatD family protein [Mycobacterium pinniadriaticum]MCX2935172.1 SatD family protein [Mycobacterium pinniadriaticum]